MVQDVALIFQNVESLETLIEALNVVKTAMNGAK